MKIREIKDDHWIIEISEGLIAFDIGEAVAYFYKRRSSILGDKTDEAPTREWTFNKEISALDVLLVIMKSLHL